MSKTVDERVVEMRFENDQFEQGIRESTKSLEMLRQALRLDDAVSSLNNVEKSLNGVDFSQLSSNIEAISNRFSRLGIIGDEVLRRITGSVTGLIGKVVGLAKTGGLTRAMNIERAKFQLSGLGVAWDDVADSINYAVKGTRYGLDEAAVVASQLVASGVELGESMSTSLRAVSGVAAMTNREYSDIGQIFTTVASNGKLMTMQLRQLSVAGLNASAALAKELGKTEEQVNEMVSKGQIDFETFAKAMDNAFGEHATRANETFEGALANMKAALSRIGAEFWTPLMDGARDILNALTPIIDAIKAGMAPLFQYFTDIVGTISARVSQMLKSVDLEHLTATLSNVIQIMAKIMGGRAVFDSATNIGRTLNGLAAIFSILYQVGQAFATVLKNIGSSLAPLGTLFLNVTAILGDFLVWLDKSLYSGNALQEIFGGVSAAIGGIIESVGSALAAFTDVVVSINALDTSPIKQFGDNMATGFHPAETILTAFKAALEAVGGVLQKLIPQFQKVGEVLSNIFGKMGEAIANGGFVKALDAINSGLITYAIANFMDLGKAGEYLSKMVKRDIAPVSSYFKTLRSTLVSYQTSIQAGTLLKIASAVALLAGSLVALSFVDPDRMNTALQALSAIIIELAIAMKVMTGMMAGAKFFAVIKATILMNSLAVSLAILSASLVALGQLDLAQIGTALVGLGGAMIVLVKGCSGLAKISGKIGPTAASMIALAIAIRIMADALVLLSALSLEGIAKGLAGLGGMMLELNLFLSKGNMSPMTMKAAAALILFGVALNVMAVALGKIGAYDFETIGKGLAGMGGVMAEIAIFAKAATGSGNLIGIGVGMALVAASMLIFAQAISSFGNMSWEVIGKGLLTLAGALTAVGVATRIMPKNMPAVGIGLIAVGAALNILAMALSSMGSMSWEQLAVGMVALGGSMTILAIAMNAMAGAVAGAAALTIMAAGLALLVPQIMALSSLSLPALGIALLGLVGVFAAFGGAAALLTPVIPTMFALGGALALLGVGIAGLGVGLLAAATGIATLAGLGAVGITTLILVITQLAETIPTVMANVGRGFVELAKALADGAPELTAAVGELIVSMLKVLSDALPKIIEFGVEFIMKLVDALVKNAPKLVQAAMTLILSLLRGIRNNIAQITTVATEIIVTFANSLRSNLGTLAAAGIELIIGLVNDMAAAIPGYAGQLGAAAANLGTAIIEGVLKGLAGFASRIGEKLMAGAKAGLAKVKSVLGINSPSKVFRDEVGKQIVRGWVQGLEQSRTLPAKALVETGQDALKAVKKSLKIHSPSIVFKEEVGRWIAEGITEGIEADTTVEEAARQKAQNIIDAFSKELSRASLSTDIAKLEFDIWQAMNPDAADYQYYSQYLRYLDEAVRMEEHRLKLAEDELEQTIEQFGYASDEAMDAQKRMLEIKKSYLEIRQEMADLDYEIETMDIREAQALAETAQELNNARLDLASSEYELWKSMNPKASELEQAKRNVMYFNEQLSLQDNKVQYLKTQLQETIAQFGEASKEALDAQNAYLKAQKDYYDIINNRENVVTNYKEGKTLTDDETKAMQEAEQTIKDQELALADYERILRDLAETNEKYGFGWTVDEMETIARKQSGYNKKTLDDARNLYKELQERTKEGAEELDELIHDKFGAFKEVFRNFGMDYGNALGDSLKDTLMNTINMLQAQLKLKKADIISAITDDTGTVLNDSGKIIGSLNSAIAASQSDPNKIDTSYFSPSSGVSNASDKAGQYAQIVANVSMTQNNTSPKSLSSSDIYNKTSSMFAQTANKVATSMMGAITGTMLKAGGVTSYKKVVG